MPRKHSTAEKRPRKPAKPEGSPLYPYNSGKWAKKIKGKLQYFGRWDNHGAALAEYESVREALDSGVDPSSIDPESFTVADACDYFLESCEHRVKRNDLAARTFADYQTTCKSLTAMLGRDTTVSKLDPPRFRELLKDLRKTCATYYDEHVPESSVEILGHSAGGVTYRHYAHRAPLAFKAIMTIPQQFPARCF